MNRKRFPADPNARPRLVCRIVRQWCALSDQHPPRHAFTCVSCQSYFAATQSLETALRRAAATTVLPTPSPEFERQILHAVRAAVTQSTRETHAASTRWRIFSGGLAATASLAVIVFLANFKPQVDTAKGSSPSAAEGAAVIVSAVQTLSNGLVDSVIPSAGELVAENPLQQELGSVYSDVQSALDFLALNFLPASTTKPTPVQTRQI